MVQVLEPQHVDTGLLVKALETLGLYTRDITVHISVDGVTEVQFTGHYRPNNGIGHIEYTTWATTGNNKKE